MSLDNNLLGNKTVEQLLGYVPRRLTPILGSIVGYRISPDDKPQVRFRYENVRQTYERSSALKAWASSNYVGRAARYIR